MVQKELQKEFQQLIKEVSKEVLELSVSKSMESAAFTVKEQVPAISKNIEQLKNVLKNLGELNSKLTRHEQSTIERDNLINSQLSKISIKVDSDIKEIKVVREEIRKKFILQEKQMENIEKLTKHQTSQLDNRIDKLFNLSNELVTKEAMTKKLITWILIFVVGSFLLLIIS